MKTEGEFNAFLSREFRKHNVVLAIKTADKYRAGLSDFIICIDGHMVCIESKFSTAEPKTSTQKVLKHTFSPEQITFLKRASYVGASSFGLVAMKSTKTMYLLRENVIEAFDIDSETLRMYGTAFPINSEGVKGIVNYIRGRTLR